MSDMRDTLPPLPEAKHTLSGWDENAYTEAEMRAYAAAAVLQERERWEQERKSYRSLLAQARLVLRGPHTEQNIVVQELVSRIESRGVQFSV